MQIINRIGQYRQAGRSWYQRATSTITKITIHHTASRQVDDDATALQHVYTAHVAQGWVGSAYHFFITKSGNIYQLNNFSDVTWHDSANWNSIGVCLDGYFHAPYNEKPTREQLQSLQELLEWLCTKNPQFPADFNDVYGHREIGSTACPGDTFFYKVKAYREANGNYNLLTDNGSSDSGSGDEVCMSASERDRLINAATVRKEVAEMMGISEPDNAQTEAYRKVWSGKEGYINQLQREKGEVETELSNKKEELDRVRVQLTDSIKDQKSLSDKLEEAQKIPVKLQGEIDTLKDEKRQLDDAWGKKYGNLQIEKSQVETKLSQANDKITSLINQNKKVFSVADAVTILIDAIINKRW